MADHETGQEAPWPLRAVLLLVLGGLAGLTIRLLLGDQSAQAGGGDAWRVASGAAIASACVVFALSLERRLRLWSAGFAILAGLTIGLVTWSNGSPDDWGSNERWQLFSGLLAVAIALPLFQTARDAGRPRFDYPTLHAHVWTNLLLGGASLAFIGAVLLLSQLLSELFNLIGIHVLSDLLRKEWAVMTLMGAAAGAAVGLLRDRDPVLRLLRQVATAMVAVLAPVLAIGLVIFVLALPFTGLESLWSETRMTTPILLVCVLGAFLLSNATIGNGPKEEPRSPLLRYGALALALVMLPLAIVAAISLGKRVAQYGYTPDRLWAGIFVLIALAAGILYFAAVLRRRRDWATAARRANIGLAITLCALALLLALPLISFGGISAANQVSRLRSGRVAPDRFDWAALRFDFGPAGRRQLAALVAGPDRLLGQRAAAAQKLEFRYGSTAPAAPMPAAVIRTVPEGVDLPVDLRRLLADPADPSISACAGEGDCLIFWKPGDSIAVAVLDTCPERLGHQAGTKPNGSACGLQSNVLAVSGGRWANVASGEWIGPRFGIAKASDQAELDKARQAMRRGQVELREVRRRQLFIGDTPASGAFD